VIEGLDIKQWATNALLYLITWNK